MGDGILKVIDMLGRVCANLEDAIGQLQQRVTELEIAAAQNAEDTQPEETKEAE